MRQNIVADIQALEDAIGRSRIQRGLSLDSEFDKMARSDIKGLEGAPEFPVEDSAYVDLRNLELMKKQLEMEDEAIANLKDDVELHNGQIPRYRDSAKEERVRDEEIKY